MLLALIAPHVTYRSLIITPSSLTSIPRAKDVTPNPHLITPRFDGTLKVTTHAHAQLQRLDTALAQRLPKLGPDAIPLRSQRHEILILLAFARRLASRDGAYRHEALESEVRTLRQDVGYQVRGLWAGGTA